MDDTKTASLDVEPAGMQPAPRQQLVRDLPKQAAAEASVLKFSEDNIGYVFAALSGAQGEFGNIETTLRAQVDSKRTGTQYAYDYAPLDEVLQAVRPALSKHGLSVSQLPQIGANYVLVKTLIGHKSGGWMMNDLRLPCDTSTAQTCGSGITYARRYSLMAILGVAPSVDDDGAAASKRKAEPIKQGQRKSATEKPADAPIRPKGKIKTIEEKGGGALVTLNNGFKAQTKDAEIIRGLRLIHESNETVSMRVRPSSDPARYAPIITKAFIDSKEDAQ